MAGQNDRAEEHYWMAQVLDAAEPRYPLFLGMMQIKKGDDDAAAASLLRAVKISPELAEGWGTLAELELKKNQNTLAAQHIERAEPHLTRTENEFSAVRRGGYLLMIFYAFKLFSLRPNGS